MPAGYQFLGCPPGMQQPPPHLVGMAGVPLPFSGIPGYSFIPYPHPGHIAHIVSILNCSIQCRKNSVKHFQKFILYTLELR